MATKSTIKSVMTINMMNENHEMIKEAGIKFGMDITQIVNEALENWLREHSYNPVAFRDGRHERWDRQRAQNGINAESK